jgi:murein DD-endopeptidase MepM/ murein hydrolase activator NlpD
MIRDGLSADVVVFDYDTIQDRSTYEQPNLYPDGIDWVLVNGEVAIDHGRHTGARSGKVIYGPGRRIAQQQTEASRPILSAPLDVTIPKPPMPFKADGQTHLVYEIQLTNIGADDCLLDRVTVLAGDRSGAELADYGGDALAAAVARPGLPALRGTAKLTVGAGQRATVYVWVSVAANATTPRALQHRLTVKLGDTQRIVTTNVGRVGVSGAPHEIGPPLRGADWLAANGPSNASGHRRTIISVDGTARIPQRFGIDWIQLRPDGSRHEGDPKDNKNYRAYGNDALAVGDGIVSAVKDGIPENVPGATSRAVPITMDTIGGNHVIVNLGDGVYAFYAHLQPGSIKVAIGDKVRRGQVLGLVGNSGNSTEPHLHFHLSDANSPLGCEGLPYAFTAFEVESRLASLAGGTMAWTPLAAPEPHKMELPLENEIVRFPEK